MTTYTKPYANVGLQTTEIKLEDHQVFHIDSSRSPMAITSMDGILWVTIPNDPEDHILKPGDQLLVNARGKVVMQAITDASFSIN
jgi:hypothetical protein